MGSRSWEANVETKLPPDRGNGEGPKPRPLLKKGPDWWRAARAGQRRGCINAAPLAPGVML